MVCVFVFKKGLAPRLKTHTHDAAPSRIPDFYFSAVVKSQKHVAASSSKSGCKDMAKY